jgi:hypothetical protein
MAALFFSSSFFKKIRRIKTIFSLFAGYPYGVTLDSVVGTAVIEGQRDVMATGCTRLKMVAQNILCQTGWQHNRRLR